MSPAACAPALGRLICLVVPPAHTATMNLFLDPLSRARADSCSVMQAGGCWAASLPRTAHPKHQSLDPAAQLQPSRQLGFAEVGSTARGVFSPPPLFLA